jgi:hypothetical protein
VQNAFDYYTFYANTGIACALQGNLDQAVVEFLRAFEEDKVSYAPTEDRSFAMMTLLPEYWLMSSSRAAAVWAASISGRSRLVKRTWH